MEQPSSSSAIGDDQRDRDRDRDDRKKNKEQEAEREDSVTRALVEKIHQHKAKVTALLQQLEKEEEEQQNKRGSSSLYSLLESEIESMAPLFDLLEPRGLAAYLSGLAIMFVSFPLSPPTILSLSLRVHGKQAREPLSTRA